MPRPKKVEDSEPFYHIHLIDAERNQIRFGPFTVRDINEPDEDEMTVKQMVENLRTDLDNEGVEGMLRMHRLLVGLQVKVVGDDGTNESLATLEY